MSLLSFIRVFYYGGMFSAKPVYYLRYYHTVSMTFDRAGYRYIGFAPNLPMENAISQTPGCFPSIDGGALSKKKLQNIQFQ